MISFSEKGQKRSLTNGGTDKEENCLIAANAQNNNEFC